MSSKNTHPLLSVDRTKRFFDALGASITFVVLMIIIVAKFREGAWLTVIVAPAAVLLMRKINQHYKKVRR